MSPVLPNHETCPKMWIWKSMKVTFNLLLSRYAGVPCWNWLLVASGHETSKLLVDWLVAFLRAGKMAGF